jgi:hypothetical protein
MQHEVELSQLQAQDALVVRGHVQPDGIAAFVSKAFGEVMETAVGQHLQVSGPPFCRYDTGAGDGWDVEAGFPVRGKPSAAGRTEPARLPGGWVAHTLHTGEYADLGMAYQAVEAWLVENGYEADGPPWESYLDPPEVSPPRTQVWFPCREVRKMSSAGETPASGT